ncbi:DUF547 domain-containing protein [Nitrosomonas aestuarii]|uniref:DUF547 domain-containing protein n=1 Tax=Nitrosomonas aestuarii TaxID=52441 RepID=UPI000D310984|nr:DUF547 domain-containing protein [Nitrosomonas aestuarii]PTN12556.1 uncharacterized protein DUF547 [Nitrosomonas aestuarii]
MKQIKFHAFVLLIILMSINSIAAASNFDHSIWDGLLHKHVHMVRQGQASEVDYHAFLKQRNELRSYLSRLSAVSYSEFARWPQAERLAFLINAYNAYTVELILTRYPNVDSIKELGSLFQSPWKKEFVPLLGKMRSLDDIEHGMIRKPGDYNEPRIHFAVNCASIGCPALLNEAFAGGKLEDQLETVTKAFLEDRTRNRYNASTGRLEVSKIFDWYTQDFESGWGGWHSLAAFFSQYAHSLTDSEQARQVVKAGGVRMRYLDYDWSLNDRK